MKPTSTLFIAIVLVTGIFLQEQARAQVPEKMSYQAVIRNSSNQLVTNTNIGMQISILQGSHTGTAVYIERHFPTTNANGLVSIEIGGGTIVLGSFSTINWVGGTYFVKIETDPTGGTSYTITGTSQILSVPYALHAKTAETFTGTINESDPVYSSSEAANINATDITNLSNLTGTNTGDQDLTDLAAKTALGDSTAQVRSEIPDVSKFISTERDPVFTAWDKDYNDLINKPARWDSTYTSIKNKPDLTVYATKDMANDNITNLADPVNDQDAVTKAYVDELINKLYADGALRVRDFDGNYYNTIKIGTQIWMAENLKTTKYNDGTAIPLVTDNNVWINLTTPGYCWYNNDAATYKNDYGALYNWYALETGKLCPLGWHVPTDAEWTNMIIYLGGSSVAGGKLKEIGTAHWASANDEATNQVGFTALPGGHRNGVFANLGYLGYWWSSTKYSTFEAYYWFMFYMDDFVQSSHLGQRDGFSVRCIKD